MPAKVLGEHGFWARLTGHLERWTRRGGRLEHQAAQDSLEVFLVLGTA